MRNHLEKLLALLEHKQVILSELIAHQERFKAFLVRPKWHEFMEYTQPQEGLLTKIRQIQSAQDFLLKELAGTYGVAHLPNLRTLCRYLEPEWKQAILTARTAIADLVTKLRGLTRLSQALNQAHWSFLRKYMAEGHGRSDLGCTYTSNGYTSRQAIMANSYFGQA